MENLAHELVLYSYPLGEQVRILRLIEAIDQEPGELDVKERAALALACVLLAVGLRQIRNREEGEKVWCVKARPLDQDIDAIGARIYSVLTAVANRASHPQAPVARLVIVALFHPNLAAFVQVKFSEQALLNQQLLSMLRGDAAALVTTMGLGEALQALTTAFARELDVLTRGTTAQAVAEAEAEALAVIHYVMGRARPCDPAQSVTCWKEAPDEGGAEPVQQASRGGGLIGQERISRLPPWQAPYAPLVTAPTPVDETLSGVCDPGCPLRGAAVGDGGDAWLTVARHASIAGGDRRVVEDQLAILAVDAQTRTATTVTATPAIATTPAHAALPAIAGAWWERGVTIPTQAVPAPISTAPTVSTLPAVSTHTCDGGGSDHGQLGVEEHDGGGRASAGAGGTRGTTASTASPSTATSAMKAAGQRIIRASSSPTTSSAASASIHAVGAILGKIAVRGEATDRASVDPGSSRSADATRTAIAA